MSSVKQFQKPGAGEGLHDTQERGTEAVQPTPATRTRTTKRFEFGLFVRKVKNGEIVFEKRIPSWKREHHPSTQTSFAATGGAQGGRKTEESGGVTKQGAGQPNPEGGPVGGTSARFEIGLFAGTTTETTTDESKE